MGFKNKFINKKCVIVLVTFLSIFFIPSVCAGEYYAYITIDVDKSGDVTIDGETNHPSLKIEDSSSYTNKSGSYWLLSIKKEEVFSDFFYALTLPESSSIIYANSSGSFRIETDNGKLIVKGFGENESFSVVVQYQLQKTTESSDILHSNFLRIILIILLIIIVIIAILLFRKSKEIKKLEEPKVSIQGYNFKGLNQRQKDIMNLLIQRKIALTQTDIQKELNIPKAAVSRNVRGLELRGLIEKEQIGMSNLIRLKKT